jgi:hypothetical protein
MKNYFILVLFVGCLVLTGMDSSKQTEWVSLFDGKTLSGWEASENPGSFRVENGAIIHDGARSHLYYVGDVANHDFKNFEFKAKVYTFPQANSGLYFHSKFQEKGFPNHGYEVQVNNSHKDRIRTGSLYNIVDLSDKYALDHTWFELYIKVVDKRVQVKVDGVLVVDYIELEDKRRIVRNDDHFGRFLTSGTFVIQAHDPTSKAMYKDIMVRILN